MFLKLKFDDFLKISVLYHFLTKLVFTPDPSDSVLNQTNYWLVLSIKNDSNSYQGSGLVNFDRQLSPSSLAWLRCSSPQTCAPRCSFSSLHPG